MLSLKSGRISGIRLLDWPDIRYTAFRLVGYPAKSVSVASLPDIRLCRIPVLDIRPDIWLNSDISSKKKFGYGMLKIRDAPDAVFVGYPGGRISG
jgi:hypothetical protein